MRRTGAIEKEFTEVGPSGYKQAIREEVKELKLKDEILKKESW